MVIGGEADANWWGPYMDMVFPYKFEMEKVQDRESSRWRKFEIEKARDRESSR